MISYILFTCVILEFLKSIYMNKIEIKALDNFPIINPGDDISEIIINCIYENNITIHNNDVFVIAQKIISKAENRYIDLDEVIVTDEAIELANKLNKDKGLIQTILNESNKIISIEKKVVIVEHKLGFVNINAGIDQSNIPNDKNLALLLPEDPSKSANDIQLNISKILNKDVSVIITDSMTRPYRAGVVNFALASSNLQSLIDLKGEPDIYGRKMKGTEIASADELASCAGLLMGQSNELKPVILIKGYKNNTRKSIDAYNLIIEEKDDLYR